MSEYTLQADAELSSTTHRKAWSRPPIEVDFQVLMFTASGLLVRFLKVFEKSNCEFQGVVPIAADVELSLLTSLPCANHNARPKCQMGPIPLAVKRKLPHPLLSVPCLSHSALSFVFSNLLRNHYPTRTASVNIVAQIRVTQSGIVPKDCFALYGCTMTLFIVGYDDVHDRAIWRYNAAVCVILQPHRRCQKDSC